jgi:hypothetical protein
MKVLIPSISAYFSPDWHEALQCKCPQKLYKKANTLTGDGAGWCAVKTSSFHSCTLLEPSHDSRSAEITGYAVTSEIQGWSRINFIHIL